jgi:gliding motility associated protien GldN
MKCNYTSILACLFVLTFLEGYGQSNLLNAVDPIEIGQKNIDQKQSDTDSFLEYNLIDDRDILWSKIVYEYIDLDEKLNFPLLFPTYDDPNERIRKSLWRVLKENILSGNITKIYQGSEDNFNYPMELDGEDGVREKIEFLKEYSDGSPPDKRIIESLDISGYKIKGMWYFDKKIGEMRYRLLGLMPVGEDVKQDEELDERNTNLFWIWYPSIREVLHAAEVYNDKNNATRISFDQLLVSRRFNSYIYKEDNMYGNRFIKDYKKPGLESILESERIKKEILDFEQDMWNR